MPTGSQTQWTGGAHKEYKNRAVADLMRISISISIHWITECVCGFFLLLANVSDLAARVKKMFNCREPARIQMSTMGTVPQMFLIFFQMTS